MPYSLTWSIAASVDGNSLEQKSQTVVTGHDHIQVTVPAKTTSAGQVSDVEIQPSSSADSLALLMITATTYDKTLTYKISGTTTEVPLDAPQLFVGAGVIGMLEKIPEKVTFTNELATEVTITILVCRNAA